MNSISTRPLFLALVAAALSLAGCSSSPRVTPPPPTSVAMYPAAEASVEGWEEHFYKGESIFIAPKPLFTERDILSVYTADSPTSDPAVGLKLTDAAGQRVYDYTKQNLRRPLAFFVDDKLIFAPMLESPLRQDITFFGPITPLRIERIPTRR